MELLKTMSYMSIMTMKFMICIVKLLRKTLKSLRKKETFHKMLDEILDSNINNYECILEKFECLKRDDNNEENKS